MEVLVSSLFTALNEEQGPDTRGPRQADQWYTSAVGRGLEAVLLGETQLMAFGVTKKPRLSCPVGPGCDRSLISGARDKTECPSIRTRRATSSGDACIWRQLHAGTHKE